MCKSESELPDLQVSPRAMNTCPPQFTAKFTGIYYITHYPETQWLQTTTSVLNLAILWVRNSDRTQPFDFSVLRGINEGGPKTASFTCLTPSRGCLEG